MKIITQQHDEPICCNYSRYYHKKDLPFKESMGKYLIYRRHVKGLSISKKEYKLIYRLLNKFEGKSIEELYSEYCKKAKTYNKDLFWRVIRRCKNNYNENNDQIFKWWISEIGVKQIGLKNIILQIKPPLFKKEYVICSYDYGFKDTITNEIYLRIPDWIDKKRFIQIGEKRSFTKKDGKYWHYFHQQRRKKIGGLVTAYTLRVRL